MKLVVFLVFSKFLYGFDNCQKSVSGILSQIIDETKKTQVRFDPSLLLDWGIDVQSKQPCKDPFTNEYLKNNKKLTYISSAHGPIYDKNHPNLSKIEIDKLFSKKPIPQLLIIEGIPSSMGVLDPEKFKREIQACEDKNSPVPCSESMYALMLARNNHVSVMGGEPDRQEEIDLMGKPNDQYSDLYTEKDYYYFILLRTINQIKMNNNNVNKENIEEYLVKVLGDSGHDPTTHRKRTYFTESFISWFKDKSDNQNFELDLITTDMMSPDKTGSFFQKFNAKLANIRDRNILMTLEENFQTQNTIAVIYGSSHLTMQELAITNAFQKTNYLGCSSDILKSILKF